MKYFLTILSILSFQLSFSQMRVEDIKTEKDIQKFINNYKHPKKYTHVKLEQKHEQELSTAQKRVIDSMGFSSVVKSDVNQDGVLDLILCGYLNGSFKAIAYISNKAGLYEMVPIYYKLDDWTLSRCYVKMIKDSLLMLATINRYQEAVKLDTLVCHNYFFQDYNSRKKDYNIDSVKISIVSMGGIETVVISPEGTISMDKFLNIDSVGHGWCNEYKIMIPKDSVRLLLGYISQLPFYKYDNWYECRNVDDGFSWATNILFKGGCVLNISDHMSIGPYGLKYLYNYTYELFSRKDLVFRKKISDEDIRAMVLQYSCWQIKWLNWDL